MGKRFYIQLLLLCLLILSGCTLPNLYDVDLPDQEKAEAVEKQVSNLEDEKKVSSDTESASAVDFTAADIVIRADKNKIYCVNNYTSDKEIAFAWYIVNKETQQPVHKEAYQKENEFHYEASENGVFQIVAYIKQDDSRTSIIAGEYSFDSEKGVNILELEPTTTLEDFSSSDIKADIDGTNIILTNNYQESKITYAWYLIDTDSNKAILKESYSENNIYEITPVSPGNYRIDAFIRNGNDERKSVTAFTFSFDGKNILAK